MNLLQSTIFVLLVSLGRSSLININAVNPQKKEVGSSIKLRCSFNPSLITRVAWTKTDGDKTVRGEEIQEEEGVSLKFTDTKITDSGNYTCSGQEADGNTTSASVELIIYAPPKVGKTERFQKFLIGKDATVVCQAEGNPKPKIKWSGKASSKNGKISHSGDNLVIYNLTEADGGEYTCEAEQTTTNEFADVMIQVIVLIPPKIHHRKKKIAVIAGESATLSCSATGNPPPSMSWFRDYGKENISVSNSSELVLTDVNISLEGATYVCVASNIVGNATSSTKLKVNVKPTINDTERVIVAEGDDAELRCYAQGIPTPTVVFYDTYLNESSDGGKNIKIRRPTFRKVSSADNRTLGSWGSDINATYSGNSGVLNLFRVKYTDKGFYECHASNDVGQTSAYLELDVLYSPKPSILYNKWACENADIVAELRCTTDANPAANFTWYKMPPEDGADEQETVPPMLLNESHLPTGFWIERDGEDSLLLINVSAASDPFGQYVCKATNDLGSSNETVRLWKAEKPQPPYLVQVIERGTRDVVLEIEVPESVDYTPYEKITLTLVDIQNTIIKSEDIKAETDKWSYSHRVTGLEHNTTYFVEVVIENCGGISDTSDPEQFDTNRISKPGGVRILSGMLSDSFDRYTIEWTVEHLGGGEIKNVTIDLFKIVEGIDSQLEEFVETFEVPTSELKGVGGSYEISGLSQFSRYRIQVNVTNDVDMASDSQEFSTPAEPTPTAADKSPRNAEASTMDKLPIIIVVAVLIGIIVIIDLACCCLKNLGLSYLIYSRTCMKKPNNSADVEGGTAKFSREDGDPDEKAVVVDEEKRPLAEDMEPASNGDPVLSKIDETEELGASNNKEEISSPNGNGTVEGGTESPEISKERNE